MHVIRKNTPWSGITITVGIRGIRRFAIARRFVPYPIDERIRFYVKAKGDLNILGLQPLHELLPGREPRVMSLNLTNPELAAGEMFEEITDTRPLLQSGVAQYWLGTPNARVSLNLISATVEDTVKRNFFLAWGCITGLLTLSCGLLSAVISGVLITIFTNYVSGK